MGEKGRFPIIVEKCPNCGSTERMAKLAYDQEAVVKGKAPPALAADAAVIVTPLFQPAMAVLTVPSLIKRYDDCARCGTRYCVEATIAQLPITVLRHQSGSDLKEFRGNNPMFG